MRFVGRDRELKKLNELYQEEEFQFVVIYGRRRVGKTMLINEFLKKKRSAYYMAVEGTSKENLSSISKVLLAEKMKNFICQNSQILKACFHISIIYVRIQMIKNVL